jgi:hypothetical protein
MARVPKAPLGTWIPSPYQKKSKAKRKIILINEHAKRQRDAAARRLEELQQRARARIQSAKSAEAHLHTGEESRTSFSTDERQLVRSGDRVEPPGHAKAAEQDTLAIQDMYIQNDEIGVNDFNISSSMSELLNQDIMDVELPHDAMLDGQSQNLDPFQEQDIVQSNMSESTFSPQTEVCSSSVSVDMQNGNHGCSLRPQEPTSQQIDLYSRWKSIIPTLAKSYMIFNKKYIEERKSALLKESIVLIRCTGGCTTKREREVVCLFVECKFIKQCFCEYCC